MHIAVFQRTANSTTFGWEQGFEALGHTVTSFVAVEKRDFGGRPGAALELIPDVRWLNRLAKRSDFVKQLTGAIPRPRVVREVLERAQPDAAIVKVDALRNMVIGRELMRLGIPWALWQEQLPPLSRRWRIAARLGLEPNFTFTVLDSREGGVALETARGLLPLISYSPFVFGRAEEVEPRPEQPVKCLVVASFKNSPAKTQWLVLEAAAEAGLLDGSVEFTFCGQGGLHDEGYLRVAELARKHRSEHLVKIRMNVGFAEMGRLYREHDFLVLPSRREQFGMAVVEAMSHGIPVIVSDAVGAIGCVIDRLTGLVFPSGDVERLGVALREMARDQELRSSLATASLSFARDHLSGVRAAERILSALSA